MPDGRGGLPANAGRGGARGPGRRGPGALHGNARRGLGAGISAIGDRMVDRINNTVVRIGKVLDDLSGTGTVQTGAIRHDAVTPENAAIAPDGAPPGIRTGSGP